jgi:hypothetical protein
MIVIFYIMLYNVLEEIKPNHTMELHDVASDNRLIKNSLMIFHDVWKTIRALTC